MNIQQLTYFLAAAEHGSFSGAARALHLAQPSISEQVRQLEAELGVELFARVGRGIALTEAGRRFRPEAERVLETLESARDAVRAVRDVRGGVLSFGMFGSASAYLIADLASTFRRRHPDVRVRLVGRNSSEVADAVREGGLEAGLVVLPVDDSGLAVRPFHREELVVASRDAGRLAEPMTIERLVEAPVILYDTHHRLDDPTRRQLDDRAQQAGVVIRPVIEVESVVAAVALAARGDGDTVVARTALRGMRGTRGLGSVSFAEPLFDTFAFITREGAPLSPATRVMIEIVEKRLLHETTVLYAGAAVAGAGG
jgi:DNA-binding transcriptional LysR family regulator